MRYHGLTDPKHRRDVGFECFVKLIRGNLLNTVGGHLVTSNIDCDVQSTERTTRFFHQLSAKGSRLMSPARGNTLRPASLISDVTVRPVLRSLDN
jgi:hypothetical protein